MDSEIYIHESWQSAVDAGAVFGLEMQHPWSQHLLCGQKTIEVRQYELPNALLGRKIYIIESRPGKDGISHLGDRIDFGVGNTTSNNDGTKCGKDARIAGWCKFDSIQSYTSQSLFEADEKKHLVPSTSGYAWQPGKTTILYGWVIHSFSDESRTENEARKFRGAERRKRSIFELINKDT